MFFICLKMEENINRKSAPKTIFIGNGNGLKNFTFLSTREQNNVHTVYVKQDSVCVILCFSWNINQSLTSEFTL